MTMHEKAAIKYILEFLVGEGNEILTEQIFYGKKPNLNFPISIIQSNFFDDNIYLTDKSIPQTPILCILETPILFGDSKVEHIDGHIICYADIVASSYYLITRYEELVIKERDIHGRFPSYASILSKLDYMCKPLVDEYSNMLKSFFREIGIEIKSKKGITQVNLTHDVDIIWEYRNLYRCLREILRRIVRREKHISRPLRDFFNYESGEIFTFPMMIELDNKIKKYYPNSSDAIYFLMSALRSENDFGYIEKGERVKKFAQYLLEEGNKIGIHSGYAVAESNIGLAEEMNRLENILNRKITMHRNHYLRTISSESFEWLIENGIEDDYTMGFADSVGFRLGTSRTVKWINPRTMNLTHLRLHPLTIMDVTLDDESYMNLSYEDSISVTEEILKTIYEYGGEANILFHNTSFRNSDDFHIKVYRHIIDYVIKLQELFKDGDENEQQV